MSKHINLSGLKTLLEPLVHLINKKAERPDWNENDVNSPSYIAGRTHYEERKFTYIVPETAIYIYDGYAELPPIQFVPDQEYIVTWKGTQYICKAYKYDNESVGYVIGGESLDCYGIGVKLDDGQFMDKYPFSFVSSTEDAQVYTMYGDDLYTFSIAANMTITHKIDEKYLPEISSVGKEGTAEGAEIFNDYDSNEATGAYSHAEGVESCANGSGAHAEGIATTSTGDGSHSEGQNTRAIGVAAHAEGQDTEATGHYSHSEGITTTAIGQASRAAGCVTAAYGDYSSVSGYGTVSDGQYSAVFGRYNLDKNESDNSYRYIRVDFSTETISTSYGQAVIIDSIPVFNGDYGFVFTNLRWTARHLLKVGDIFVSTNYQDIGSEDNPKFSASQYFVVTEVSSSSARVNIYTAVDGWNEQRNIVTVGNGTDDYQRSNAHTLDWQGNAWYAGDVYVGSTSGKDKDEGSHKLATEKFVSYAKDHIALIDQVTGKTYIVCMHNGNLVFTAAVTSINVASMPIKTVYTHGEYFDPSGMTIIATCHDGSTREITNYSYKSSFIDINDTDIEIYYEEGGVVHKTKVPIVVNEFDPSSALVDFNYINNDNGTYTIIEWKGTCHGLESTEIILPDNALIVL